MLPVNTKVVGNEFRVGYRKQKVWSWSMATAFFFGEIGAGLFFVSVLAGLKPGLLLGLLMVAVGKATGHLVHLGQPARAWRAIRNVRRSWISRGLASIVVFTGSGSLVVADAFIPGVVPPPIATAATALAMLAALVVMVYQGLSMSQSQSIALWSNGLMPVTSFVYSLMGGVVVALVLGWDQLASGRLDMLQAFALGLVLMGLVVVGSLVHAAKYGPEGGQKSADLLLSSNLTGWFVSMVMVVGFLITGLFLALGAGNHLYLAAAAVTELAGYYAFRILMFKGGMYDPILTFGRHGRRA